MTARNDGIAIVGMACRYPDARTTAELWENVLAQRRSFRRMPPERMRVEDYFSSDRSAADRTYSCEAALIEGYEFDRVKFRVSGSQFRSADLAHWLALDIASQALADAGFEGGEGLPRESTGVLLANTLTGDTSRANVLRLRWPYVRRVVGAAMAEQGRTSEEIDAFLRGLEPQYKSPFPEVNEETLAGGLSNTIAGRICNHFDFKGGGYTLDGACAASLLAVSNACSALVAGDLDVAVAGGVDVSLDPFELIGFAKAGALAADEMRVYDARSAGFWPGEGCGFVVLMREPEALRQGRRIHAVIRGWGVSSDGSGGMTRPEPAGQRLALARAYRRAGFGIDTIDYFEGHGTGTRVGDETELGVLTAARREAAGDARAAAARPAPIGSIKANIGHTKAAAGLAGLIKAAMAAREGVVPPITGCGEPHAILRDGGDGAGPALRVARVPESCHREGPMRAAVSAMGFGGLNSHVVLEGPAPVKAASPVRPIDWAGAQDAELFAFAAGSADELRETVVAARAIAPRLSRGELTDLSGALARRADEASIAGAAAWRAAVVAGGPSELAERLDRLAEWIDGGETSRLDATGVFLGSGADKPRIGLLFPGQGCPARRDGGAWRDRFAPVRSLYASADLPAGDDDVQTDVAQPAIVVAELAALRMLAALGVEADAAAGHSLGELTALSWAGAMDEAAVLRLAKARGRAMADLPEPHGAMAALMASPEQVEPLLAEADVVVSAYNGPELTVVSGPCRSLAQVMARADEQRIGATRLKVSHAFHSPLVSGAAAPLARHMRAEPLRPINRRVFSTITGCELSADARLDDLLVKQLTAPVRFTEAVRRMAAEADLLIEAGPGRVLAGLVGRFAPTPVVSVESAGESMRGLLGAAGAAFASGAAVRFKALFEGRLVRAIDLDWRPRFFSSPCEAAPVLDDGAASWNAAPHADPCAADEPRDRCADAGGLSAFDVVRELVARKAELPVESVTCESRLLGDLHLNSIVVGQIAVEACQRLGMPAPVSPTQYAGATVGGMAEALAQLGETSGIAADGGASAGRRSDDGRPPAGVDSWVRPFVVRWNESSLGAASRGASADEGAESAQSDSALSAAATSDGWRVIAHPFCPFRDSISAALARGGRGAGVLICVPAQFVEGSAGMLLDGARAAMDEKGPGRLVIVQDAREQEPPGGLGAEAFARTVHHESPQTAVSVVHVPIGHPSAADWVLAETRHASGFREVRYDSTGRRHEPVLAPMAMQAGAPSQTQYAMRTAARAEARGSLAEAGGSLAEAGGRLTGDDVMLVTGGGKGIAAECAMELARDCGVKLALVGRSDPTRDTELSENLERMRRAGVTFKYLRADVCDADAVRAQVREAERALGPVTAFLHGAGANTPRLVKDLDKQSFNETILPKMQGARNVLAAIDAERLKLLVGFGSLIARAGMAGEADYAVANDWLASLVERWGAEHPHCRALAIEWSVWSGVGMGERLGRIDALARQGISAISPEQGVRELKRLLAGPTPPRVVVTGRFGDSPTLRLAGPPLPFRRFLESPRVYYPGVELVADARLSPQSDPHLNDHVFHGERLFAAVLGLEAMAQAAMAVAGTESLPRFESVALTQPIVVPESGVTIRVAALAREDGAVDVAVRSEQTGFAVDHFRAVCRFDASINASDPSDGRSAQARLAPAALPDRLDLSPADLYGRLLFHTGRFRVVHGYRQLESRSCVAELGDAPVSGDAPTSGNGNGPAGRWFGAYLPAELVLGCPAARDGTIHAIQACIPHATILPTGVERLTIHAARADAARFVEARERSQVGPVFTYDVWVHDADGRLIETWEGLTLRAIGPAKIGESLPASLVGPYVERRAGELLGAAVRIAADSNGHGPGEAGGNGNGNGNAAGNGHSSAGRRESTNALLERLLGGARVSRRPDGRPAAVDGRSVSAAHGAGLALAAAVSTSDGPAAAAADAPIGCDVEPVESRDVATWRGLLGAERQALAELIASRAGERLDAAATRVWTAIECVKKAGLPDDTPLTLGEVCDDGWVVIRAGRAFAAATAVLSIRDTATVAVGVLAGMGHAGV